MQFAAEGTGAEAPAPNPRARRFLARSHSARERRRFAYLMKRRPFYHLYYACDSGTWLCSANGRGGVRDGDGAASRTDEQILSRLLGGRCACLGEKRSGWPATKRLTRDESPSEGALNGPSASCVPPVATRPGPGRRSRGHRVRRPCSPDGPQMKTHPPDLQGNSVRRGAPANGHRGGVC